MNVIFFKKRSTMPGSIGRNSENSFYMQINNGFCGFEIYYQLVMHTREHSLVSAEALMRFFVPADPDADGDETAWHGNWS